MNEFKLKKKIIFLFSILKPGPKWIAIPVIARAVLQFVFYALCNYAPHNKTRHFPVYITNDYVMWFGGALSPLLFGYFTSLLMMYTPK